MTSIEWVVAVAKAIGGTPETWNPIRARDKKSGRVGWFCVHESEGCRNCYAEAWNAWRGNGVKFRAQDRDKVDIYLDEDVLSRPLRWRKRRAVFPCDMTDIFAEWVTDEWLDKILAVMALTPDCVWMPLTKRAKRMREYLNDPDARESIAAEARKIHVTHTGDLLEGGLTWPLPNVWLGVSVEDQAAADERIPELLATPAAVRFVSAEPLLGPVDLKYPALTLAIYPPSLDWVIAGFESGPKARPGHPDWARKIRKNCARNQVPFFFKQWGEYAPHRDIRRRFEGGDKSIEGSYKGIVVTPDGVLLASPPFEHNDRGELMLRVGRKAAGRTLDGVVHDGIPEVPHD